MSDNIEDIGMELTQTLVLTLFVRCKSEYIPGLERGNFTNSLILKEQHIQVSSKASIIPSILSCYHFWEMKLILKVF